MTWTYIPHYFDGLVQERCNSSVLAMEDCPSASEVTLKDIKDKYMV